MRFVLAAVCLVSTVGCASAVDRICEENARCAGEASPSESCAEQRAECDEDADCAEGRDRCAEVNEKLSQCILDDESSACRDVGEASFYLPGDNEKCQQELEDFLACAT